MHHCFHRYRELFSVSLPLVLSMAAITVMEFTDRVFLANYSIDAIAAALPAGVATFLILTFFTGVTGYLNVFIAQYTGAGATARIGPCIWQGFISHWRRPCCSPACLFWRNRFSGWAVIHRRSSSWSAAISGSFAWAEEYTWRASRCPVFSREGGRQGR